MGKKLTQKEFLKKLLEKNEHYRNGEFEVVEFLSIHLIVRTRYGDCKSIKQELLLGRKPSILSAINKTDFCKKELESIRGNRYDYSLVSYISAKAPLDIICDRHGIFNQSFDTHKKGHNCPFCAREDRTYSRDYIIEYLNKNNFDNSTIKVLTDYGIKSELEVVCSVGHVYASTFSRRKSKNGCGECHKMYLYLSNNNITKDSYLIPMIFYVLELLTEGKSIFKVGITKNIEERIKDIKAKSKYNINILMQLNTNLYEAYKMEQYFLNTYKPFKTKNLIAFGGHTECFTENPLNYEYYYKTNTNESNN